MVLLDAKEILELVRSYWSIIPSVSGSLIEDVINGGFESGNTGWTFNAASSIITGEHHTGTHAVQSYSDATGFYQTFSTYIKVNDITSFTLWAKGNTFGGEQKLRVTYTDNTYTDFDIVVTLNNTWQSFNPLSSLTTGKSIKEIRLYSGSAVSIYYDDISIKVNVLPDILLQLDEYQPLHPDYQIVFINRPERTYFVAPDVVKHEQDVVLEVHEKLVHYEPTDLDTQRTTFKAIKGELSRIFNTYRFDEVGSIVNMSGWVDAKLPHGFGLGAEPLEFVTRLTVQIFYYEAIGSTKIGVRVKSVEILGADLLGLIDVSWDDTNPWVHIQVPKGPLLEQHLLGPHINGEITTHDYASLYTRLYETPIVVGGVQYPILVDQTKLTFSKVVPTTPQFIIELVDSDGTVYTYDFFYVRIKQVELMKTGTSGITEAVWKITFMADYIYYVAAS